MAWDDDFFGFQLVVNQIETRVIKLFEALSSQVDGQKYIIYGELFGGKYPHPSINEDPRFLPIQTGIYYSPDIHFCAFDIAIENHGGQSKWYLDYETAISYFNEYELLFAQPLKVDKLGVALNFDIRMNSTIPSQLALPELKENLIEGVVIKPYNNRSPFANKLRPILKLKNPEFEEEKAFHKAEKWSFIPQVSSKSHDLSFLVEELRSYITQNRLQSAISKIGALNSSDNERTNAIKEEFLNDTLADFTENHGKLLDELSHEQKSWVIDRVKAAIDKLLKNSP